MKNQMKIITIIAILIFMNGCERNNERVQVESNGESLSQETFENVDTSKEDIISNKWSDVLNNINGSEIISACSNNSGNCYNVEADISNGTIDAIHFSNGGYLNFSAEIDSNGDASDVDQDGNNWTFSIDMNSNLITEAINNVAEESQTN